MARSALYWQVYGRLVEDEEVDDRVRRLVEAAFDGTDAVREALESTDTGLGQESSVAAGEAEEVPGVFLEKLQVTGFRGIGETVTFGVDVGPGLTVVIGRNGSGKSSLAEALEVLLTGESLRWKGRKQKAWISGWRNLHYKSAPWIRGTFRVEGAKQPVEVTRRWEGEELEDVEVTGAVGEWDEALDTFRPILSYNELGAALEEGPSHLYDLLRGVLGMEEVTRAVERLVTLRKELAPLDKQRKAARAALEKELDRSSDERVDAVRKAMRKTKSDIDKLIELAVGEGDDEQEAARLKKAAAVQVPTSDEVLGATAAMRAALQRVAAMEGTDTGQEAKLAALLRQALAVHEHDGGEACMVCGTPGVLGEEWRAEAQARIASMEEAEAARKEAGKARRDAEAAVRRVAQRVSRPPIDSLDAVADAQAAFEDWTSAPADAAELADHLEATYDALEAAYTAYREEAKAKLGTLQAEWRPIRQKIDALIEAFEAAEKAKPDIKALRAAEKWLATADNDLRNDRFTPIRDQAQKIWEELRQRSNVSLNDVRLEGKKTSRRVELEVAVDGVDAVALGVMSQGELHAMLLSLFLPRLTLDESPFRFLVVDDPVQAMDPAKVDGLARVLTEVAETRQVVVFTHDGRLPAALRRMELPARIVEVSRGDRSKVTLRDTRNPVRQFLDDARDVVSNQHEFAPKVAARVVPGLCRAALESEMERRVWARLLGQGLTHIDVEARLEGAKKLYDLAEIALLDDPSANLYTYLNNKVGSRAVDTFKAVNEGAHDAYAGDVRELVKSTEKLLRGLGATV